jgi:hypothetical protein
MPRRIFTPRDLEPVRKLLENPAAAMIAGAAEPFKRRTPGPRHVETPDVTLPVEIQSRENPEGVPLHEIARVVGEEVAGVAAIAVKRGAISVRFERPPTAAERRRLEALLGDEQRLGRLPGGLGAAVGGRRPAPPARPPAAADPEVLRTLHDPQTSDSQWLKAFRRYAMARLVEPLEE